MPGKPDELDIQPYSYANQIKTPDDLGIKAGTNWDNITDGFSGLIAYMKVLIVGGGKAQKNCYKDGKEISGCTKPLGDRYLLKTMGKCKAKSTDTDEGKCGSDFGRCTLPNRYCNESTGKCASKEFRVEKRSTEYDYDGRCGPKGADQHCTSVKDPYCNESTGECGSSEDDKKGSTTEYDYKEFKETEELVTRYVYLNNIPDGQIPFMGAATKGVMPKGLVPGVFKNIAGLNPIPIIKSFTESSTPDCTAISVSIVDTDNTNRIQVAHVANSEIKDIDPCVFAPSGREVKKSKRINPITNVTCQKTLDEIDSSGFTNRYRNNLKPLEIPQISDFPEDPIIKVYYISIGLLMLYILTKHIHKVNKKINIK